jgi:hypothetical protein
VVKIKRKKKPPEEKPKKQKKGKPKNVDMWEMRLQMCTHMPEQVMAIDGMSRKELDEEIADLEQKIQYSKQGKSARRKGSGYENAIAKRFHEKWGVRLVRTPSSGGFQKQSDNETLRGDISSIDKNVRFLLHIECKNHKTWTLKKWWGQTTEDCPSDNIPLLIYHQGQVNQDGKRVQDSEDYVMIKLDDFLDIVDTDKVIIKKQEGIPRDIQRGEGRFKGARRDAKRKSL